VQGTKASFAYVFDIAAGCGFACHSHSFTANIEMERVFGNERFPLRQPSGTPLGVFGKSRGVVNRFGTLACQLLLASSCLKRSQPCHEDQCRRAWFSSAAQHYVQIIELVVLQIAA
jgi:hypothetical protein